MPHPSWAEHCWKPQSQCHPHQYLPFHRTPSNLHVPPANSQTVHHGQRFPASWPLSFPQGFPPEFAPPLQTMPVPAPPPVPTQKPTSSSSSSCQDRRIPSDTCPPFFRPRSTACPPPKKVPKPPACPPPSHLMRSKIHRKDEELEYQQTMLFDPPPRPGPIHQEENPELKQELIRAFKARVWNKTGIDLTEEEQEAKKRGNRRGER